MLARQAALVALSVRRNVHGVTLLQLLAVLLDDVPAAGGDAGLLGGVVGVASRAIPVPRDGLRVKGDLDVEHLTDAHHDVAGHPQVVAHVDANAWPDLVLPLGRQHLAVDARDVDAGVQAQPVECGGGGGTNGSFVEAIW